LKPPPEVCTKKFWVCLFAKMLTIVQPENVVVTVYFRSAGASVLSSLMTMTVDLMDVILADFSVEMIAQTVLFILILLDLC